MSVQSRFMQHLKDFLCLIGSDEIAEALSKPEHQTNFICAPLEKVGVFVHNCLELFEAKQPNPTADELDVGQEDIASLIGSGLNVDIEADMNEKFAGDVYLSGQENTFEKKNDQSNAMNASNSPPAKRPKVDVLSLITDTKEELKKKINSFIEKKRQQNNISNQLEFCNRTDAPSDEPTCSRIDACVDERSSKVRITRADTSQVVTVTPEKYGEPPLFCIDLTEVPDGVDERVRNAEYYLRVKKTGAVPKDVYQRLRAIETRILEIEHNGTLAKVKEWEDSETNRTADTTKKAFNRMPSTS